MVRRGGDMLERGRDVVRRGADMLERGRVGTW